MKRKHTSWLSLMTVLAMVAAPSRAVLAWDCPMLSPGGCLTASVSDGQDASCCCEKTPPKWAGGPDSDTRGLQDTDTPSDDCQCSFYGVPTNVVAMDLSGTPIISIAALDSFQYLPQAVHPSDWVSRILRPPVC